MLLSAFVVGCAVQIKYNFLVFAAIWLLWLLAHAFLTHGLRRGVKWCLAPVATSVVVGCPWFLYQFAAFGNPVFPFLNDLFRSPYWPAGTSTSLNIEEFGLGESLFDRLFFPWTVTRMFDGLMSRWMIAFGWAC